MPELHNVPLESAEWGDNELLISVSESGGGWGIQARFDDLDGLALSEG